MTTAPRMTGTSRDPVSAAGPLAVAIAGLVDQDELLARFATMHLDRVRYMRPLAGEDRADTLPRARRRASELPSAADLDAQYRCLRGALDAPVEVERARGLVAAMLHALRGRPAELAILDGFAVTLAARRIPLPLVAGAVMRAIATCRVRPSPAAFLAIVEAHRLEVRTALDLVTRTMGLRKDAEKVSRQVSA